MENGADILNVSAGPDTPQVVAKTRKKFPYIPIIATGKPSEENMTETLVQGANALTYTPPSNAELFKLLMEAIGSRYLILKHVSYQTCFCFCIFISSTFKGHFFLIYFLTQGTI